MKSKSVKPSRLQYGDVIALVRPSSKLDFDQFRETASRLRELGFPVLTYPGKFPKDPVFASDERSRRREWEWAFRHPAVKVVLACRGGYGAARMVSQISRSEMRKWPRKIFVGYSDSTYLHQWLQNEIGWTTIHGPLVGWLKKNELKILMDNLLNLPAEPQSHIWSEVKVLQAGKATGRLVGGNLSLLSTTGRAALPRSPVILAIEDVNEPYYKLDRMIWNLIDAGYGRYVKGLIVGHLQNCGESDSRVFKIERWQESLRRLTKGPIWWGARFGHGVKNQRLLPLGIMVQMSGKEFITREPVVS